MSETGIFICGVACGIMLVATIGAIALAVLKHKGYTSVTID